MGRLCCIDNCVYGFITDDKISKHRFPRNIELNAKWIATIKTNSKLKIGHYQELYICGRHFEPQMYKKSSYLHHLKVPNRKCLIRNAIPTIFSVGNIRFDKDYLEEGTCNSNETNEATDDVLPNVAPPTDTKIHDVDHACDDIHSIYFDEEHLEEGTCNWNETNEATDVVLPNVAQPTDTKIHDVDHACDDIHLIYFDEEHLEEGTCNWNETNEATDVVLPKTTVKNKPPARFAYPGDLKKIQFPTSQDNKSIEILQKRLMKKTYELKRLRNKLNHRNQKITNMKQLILQLREKR